MNSVRTAPPQPRTIDEERLVAESDQHAREAAPHQHEGNSSQYAVRFPDGHVALVSQANLRGALACGGVVIEPRETPKMSPTVNGAVAPRIHVLG